MPVLPSPRASLPLLASVMAVVLSTGFTGTLLPLAVGGATAAAGVASAHYAGFLLGAPATGWIIARLGEGRAALLFALAIALTTAGLVVVNGLPAWMGLRFATGIAVSGYFVLMESRLNALAGATTRGRLMAAYLVAFYAAQATGASAAGFVGPGGAMWMLATLPLPLLGVLPLLRARAAPSSPVVPPSISSRPSWSLLLSRAPAAYASSVASGLLLGAFYGLGPVYAAAIGGGAFASGPFMAFAMVGGMLLLLPVGRGADRGDRKRWLATALVATTGASMVLALAPVGDFRLLILAGALLGGCAFTVYPLASGCVNDAVRPEERLAANSLLLLLNALGSCAGPVLAGWAMSRFGVGSMLLPAAMACFATALLVAGTRRMPILQSA